MPVEFNLYHVYYFGKKVLQVLPAKHGYKISMDVNAAIALCHLMQQPSNGWAFLFYH